MEYASFAGKIPRGEYGGGDVIVWDHGTYDELKWSDREVMVVLHGERTQGTYVLFATDKPASGGGKAAARRHGGRAAQTGRSWMIHKMDDDPVDYEPLPARDPAHARHAGPTCPRTTTPGRTSSSGTAFGPSPTSTADVSAIESRNGNDLTPSFPELRALGEQLGSRRVVLDGEIVAFDEVGPSPVSTAPAPDPRLVTPTRRRPWPPSSPSSTSCSISSTIDGASLLGLSYTERRRRLDDLGLLATKPEHWTLSPQFAGPGADVLRASQDPGARRGPRQASRLALSAREAISELEEGEEPPDPGGGRRAVGRPGVGNREGRLGSLLLGIPAGKGLQYIGQVGTGFSVVDPRRPGSGDSSRLQRRATRSSPRCPVATRMWPSG